LYLCTMCGAEFEEPIRWLEHHIDESPGEWWSGCPCCGESYEEADVCLRCGQAAPLRDLAHGFCSRCGAMLERELLYVVEGNFDSAEIEYLKEAGMLWL